MKLQNHCGTMEPSAKKAKIQPSSKKIIIRLCDAFIRTDGNIICPVIKAENSIRVLYKLEKGSLLKILQDVGRQNELIYQDIELKSVTDNRKIQGNLFIEYLASKSINLELNKYKEELLSKLTEISNVKDILIHNVEDKSKMIPQPIISDSDFEMHKLELCSKRLSEMSEESTARPDLVIAADNIKSQLEDLKDHYTRFAILSQNGKGKSFILNLLMLLTADNEDEYRENNANLKLPEDIPQNTTLESLSEIHLTNLPDVVKGYVKSILEKKQDTNQDTNQDFHTVVTPVCQLLNSDLETGTSSASFSDISKYFSEKKGLDIEPYILPQKAMLGSYESTTKCIIHLRYGTVYQMRVDYFEEKELQNQLFELVTLNEKETSSDMNEDIKEKAIECLKARFEILTQQNISENAELLESLSSPEDIKLSEEVQQFAGKTELYFGKGNNSAQDRLALKDVLKTFTPSQDDNFEQYQRKIAAVKKIVVYLPSKILHGGKEILEMPGTDDSDPMATHSIKNALEDVDAVILISDFSFKIVEKEVKDMLTESTFLSKFLSNPNDYKLMLLSYPEKNQGFQYRKDSSRQIIKLEQEEQKKRKEELKMMTKLIRMDAISEDIERNIITSYILPVLHTSILSQPGPEHEVLTKHDIFLRRTGILNLINLSNEYVASKHRSTYDDVYTELSRFKDEITEGMTAEDAKCILNLLSNKEVKKIREPELTRKNEHLLIDLKKELDNLLNMWVTKEVTKMLQETIEHAKEKWEKEKHKVTSISLYNPYFYGKNPTAKVRLFNVFFDSPVKEEIFSMIKDKIELCLQKYKEKTILLFTEELNSLLTIEEKPTVSSDFVGKIINSQLDDALK
ncbi:uncharacterized protein LOC128480772 isoform X2 [Spea bombifrons]|nr:uncharacterized protein LOC128480772 isoform X2 [Spea bombifrons]